MQKVINELFDELLVNGQIEPSTSPYNSPIILVKKKDYLSVNGNSIKVAYSPKNSTHFG